jgi:hypothetical protein
MGMKMNERTDIYLRRSLKNWAAFHYPPSDGRKRLLQALTSPPSSPLHKSLSLWIESLRLRYFSPIHESTNCDWFVKRVTISQDWYWQVSYNLQLSHLVR